MELHYSVPTVAEESQSASASSLTAGTAAPRNAFEVRSTDAAQFVAIQPTEEARQEYSDRTLRAQDPAKHRFLKAEDDLNVFFRAALELVQERQQLQLKRKRAEESQSLRLQINLPDQVRCYVQAEAGTTWVEWTSPGPDSVFCDNHQCLNRHRDASVQQGLPLNTTALLHLKHHCPDLTAVCISYLHAESTCRNLGNL